jgi:hypothetical protein
MPRHAQHLPFDAIDDIRRQDDLVAGYVWAVDKGQQRVFVAVEHLVAECDHVAAQDVVLDAELPNFRDNATRPIGACRSDLDAHAPVHAVFFGPAHQQDSLSVGVTRQVDRTLHARPAQAARPRWKRLRLNAANAGSSPFGAVQ